MRGAPALWKGSTPLEWLQLVLMVAYLALILGGTGALVWAIFHFARKWW